MNNTGEGYVLVEEPSKFSLSGGMLRNANDPSSTAAIFGVSMFHQLHCLVSLPTSTKLS